VKLEVRQATLADRDAIQRFIRSAYDDLAPYKGPERWAWQFGDNPYLGPTDGRTPVWIALDGDAVVGQIAVQGADFKIGEVVWRGGWIVDVMIDANFRGHGLGHRLYEAASQEVDLLVTLTMAPATRRMADRLGAVNVSPTHLFSRWERITATDARRYLIQRTEHRERLARLTAFACKWLAAGHFVALGANFVASMKRPAPNRPADHLGIVEVARFGPEADLLWDRISPHYPVLSRRDSQFLNWRFVDCPTLKYRRFLAYQSDEPVGYLVLRSTEPEELRQGVIVDIFAAPDRTDVLTGLLSHAVATFRGQVATIECGTSSPAIQRALLDAGFFRVRTHLPTVVVAASPLRAEVEAQKDAWFLSKADHDWDQVHLA